MTKNRLIYKNSLSTKEEEFGLFFIRFVGYLIHRGKKSKAIKDYDYIIYNLKKYYRYENIINILYRFFLKLYPIFNVKYKRFGKNYQPIPKLAYGNVKNVLIFSWFLKSLKGKSNIYGINLKDVINVIIDTMDENKSIALSNKSYFYKRALSGRHFLKNVRKSKSRSRSRSRGEN